MLIVGVWPTWNVWVVTYRGSLVVETDVNHRPKMHKFPPYLAKATK